MSPRSTLLTSILWLSISGCLNSTLNSVPARFVPESLRDCSRTAMVPIDFTLLQKPPVVEHVIGPGDVLGIHIQEVVGKDEEPQVFFPPVYGNVDYGNVNLPASGSPITVKNNGTIVLPQVPPIRLSGLTLPEAEEALRQAYTSEEEILPRGRERITVTLIRPRSYRVTVIREDTGPPAPTSKYLVAGTLVAKRGSAHVIELPGDENDVLHALTLTGGLPGIDGKNEIVILRAGHTAESLHTNSIPDPALQKSLANGEDCRKIRIPLRQPENGPLPFGPEDVVLRQGDVIYIEARDSETFVTGGLLPGGRFPLPRDTDLDVFGAMAIAGGSAGGPAGTNAASYLFRGGSGPGNIVPPTRVIVLRTVPGQGQVSIHIDLKRALRDPRERLGIQSGDVVMLQYTPCELATNYLLNLFNFNVNVARTYLHAD